MIPTYLVQFAPFRRLPAVELVQAIQPRKLKELLREEETANELRLGTDRGQVAIMDSFHIGTREQAILLGREVVDEGGRCLAITPTHCQPAVY